MQQARRDRDIAIRSAPHSWLIPREFRRWARRDRLDAGPYCLGRRQAEPRLVEAPISSAAALPLQCQRLPCRRGRDHRQRPATGGCPACRRGRPSSRQWPQVRGGSNAGERLDHQTMIPPAPCRGQSGYRISGLGPEQAGRTSPSSTAAVFQGARGATGRNQRLLRETPGSPNL